MYLAMIGTLEVTVGLVVLVVLSLTLRRFGARGGLVLGALLLTCFVTNPRQGTSLTNLVPWEGSVELAHETIPFRDTPENFLKVKDYTPYSSLIARMADRDEAVEAAIRAAAQI